MPAAIRLRMVVREGYASKDKAHESDASSASWGKCRLAYLGLTYTESSAILRGIPRSSGAIAQCS